MKYAPLPSDALCCIAVRYNASFLYSDWSLLQKRCFCISLYHFPTSCHKLLVLSKTLLQSDRRCYIIAVRRQRRLRYAQRGEIRSLCEVMCARTLKLKFTVYFAAARQIYYHLKSLSHILYVLRKLFVANGCCV